MANLVSISNARANLPDLVDKVDRNMDRVVITVNGRPKATLISAEELESIEETAEILAIPGARKRIKEGLEQIKRGEVVSFEEIISKKSS